MLARRLQLPITKALTEQDKDLLDGLSRTCFLTDQGEDGSGFIVKSMMTALEVKTMILDDKP